MAGTREGGLHAAETNKERHGEDFYARIGAIGGSRGHSGGFASEKVGTDGLTGRQRASVAGTKGGYISRRGPTKHIAVAMPASEAEEVAVRTVE